MTTIIRKWLTPPLFDDDIRTRQAFILHYILLALLAVPICYSGYIFLQEPERIRDALVQSIPSEILNILLFILVRKGHLSIASILQVTLFWLFFALVAYTNQGVRDTAYILGNAAVIVVAGILLGERGAFFFTTLTVLIGGWMVYLESTKQRFLNAEIDSTQFIWVVSSILFTVINVVQYLSTRTVREAFQRARASEALFRTLLENIQAITYINGLEIEAPTLYISPQVQKMLGYSKDEFIEDPLLWQKIIHPADRDRVLKENEATSQSRTIFNMEYRLITKEGNTLWVNDKARLITSEDGNPQHWLGTWVDITPQKQVDEQQADLASAMSKRAIQLQTVAEVSRASSSMLDLEELLATAVERIQNHFNYYYVGIFLLNESKTFAVLKSGTGEAGKQMMVEGHQLEVADTSMIGWSVTHRKARIALDVGEDAIRFKNPHLPLTRSEITLPLISRGDVIGAMTIQSELPSAFSQADITALQIMADQIANAISNAKLFAERADLIKELEARNAELERFTYTVSHDLKSPLVTIRGFLGFIREEAIKGELEKFERDLSKIANAADRMQDLLNDLLELSRVGRIAHPPQAVAMQQIVHETMELLAGSLKEYNIEAVVQEPLPVVHGDKVRLVEVMQNLLSNAIKFMGEQSGPRIEIGCTGQDAEGMAILYVRDNGIGIDPQHHDRIFGLFNRLDPSIEGTGVGLTLIRRIIEVHGGKVWLESQPGVGSTFFFTLPLANRNDSPPNS